MTKKVAELKAEIESLKAENIKLHQLVYGTSDFKGSNDDPMVLLKLSDYSTEILARLRIDKEGFKKYYVMLGSGKCILYGDFGVEWVKPIS